MTDASSSLQTTFAWRHQREQVLVSCDVIRCGVGAEQRVRPDTWVHWSPCWLPSSCHTPIVLRYLAHTHAHNSLMILCRLYVTTEMLKRHLQRLGYYFSLLFKGPTSPDLLQVIGQVAKSKLLVIEKSLSWGAPLTQSWGLTWRRVLGERAAATLPTSYRRFGEETLPQMHFGCIKSPRKTSK